MIPLNCNYCEADDTHVINHGPDLLLNRPGDYFLVQCKQCGLIYQNPRLTLAELAEHYPQSYELYKPKLEQHSSRRKQFDEQFAIVRRCNHVAKYQTPPGVLLDIGCSTGLFLNQMRTEGWQPTGVEFSSHAADYARNTFGLDVFTGTVEQAQFPSDHFDVVTMWDVLEHVLDPLHTLYEVQRILKPGGLLAVSLPNPDSIGARLFGGSWVGWDRPRHLHLFTIPVLKKYVTATGLQLEAVDSLGGRWGLTLMSVEFWCKAHGISAVNANRLTRLLYNRPLRLLTWPFYRLGEKANKTTSMNLFIRKPSL